MARSKSKLKRLLFKKERYFKAPSPLGEQSREQRRQQKGEYYSFKTKLIAAALLVAAGALVYFFGFIRQIEVVGLQGSTSAEVKALAEDYLERNWYTSFKPLADIGGLADSIELSESRFSGTMARTSLFSDKLVISSNVRQPAAVWQSSQDPTTAYPVDASGVIFTDEQADTSGLPIIKDTTSLDASPGMQMASADTIDFLLLLDNQLDKENIYTDGSRQYLLVESPREMQLKPGTEGFVIKFITDRGVRDQVLELKAMLDHLSDTGRSPSRYIDLRIDDTAFYR